MRSNGAARPLTLSLYSAVANALAPLVYRRVRRKLGAHGTDPARFRERLGHATIARPTGRLIWFHAASVGESLSILQLISHMGSADPDLRFLITSGTATSGEVLSRRLPPRCVHQFAPIDSRAAVARFLAHWHPDTGVFVESELWPQMLEMSRAAGVPLALINARISDRSARNWTRFAKTAHYLMSQFRVIHCQDARTEKHLRALGLGQAQVGQNLKSAAGALPYDADALAQFRRNLGQRPLWVASSTHPGEDEIVLDAHQSALSAHPDLLLLLVPRHPERAESIIQMITTRDLRSAQRSAGQGPRPDTSVYLADTMGETGLWYALSPIVFLGGSLVPVGGHNPFEPACAGAAILHGPLYVNFAQAYADITSMGGSVEITDAAQLAQSLTHLLTSPEDLTRLRENARNFGAAQGAVLDDLTGRLFTTLQSA